MNIYVYYCELQVHVLANTSSICKYILNLKI